MHILTEELAPLLGLRADVLLAWPSELKPAATLQILHSYEDVNVWLATPGKTRGFAQPPTIEQLIAGEITLVLLRVATPLLVKGLGIRDAKNYIRRRIMSGCLDAVKLRPYTWAVSMQSVRRLIRHRQTVEDLDMEEMKKVFGFGRSRTYAQLVESGELTVVKDAENPHLNRITRASALALLTRLLRQTTSPVRAEDWFVEDWLNTRRKSTEPLLTVDQTAARLGVSRKKVMKLILEGRLLYIPSPGGGKRFISPETVAGYQGKH